MSIIKKVDSDWEIVGLDRGSPSISPKKEESVSVPIPEVIEMQEKITSAPPPLYSPPVHAGVPVVDVTCCEKIKECFAAMFHFPNSSPD